jgi:CIC family chloride channel protein
MGAGYESIDKAIHGQFTWQFLLMLAVLKIVATLLSFLSGTPGGMFAPTLFIGAMFGAAVGGAEHALLPQLAVSPSTYALVGMGVLFAGFLRAPITSVFMILEMSGNYSIIVPVMVANTFAYVIPRALHQTALFDLISSQDGVELPSMEELREERILRVEDAMKPHLDLVLEASEIFRWHTQLTGYDASDTLLVRLQPSGWSCVSKEEIESSLEEDKSGQILISTLACRQIPCLHPDQPLDVALRYVDRWPIVPVVNRADFRKLEGIITRGDVLETYSAVL